MPEIIEREQLQQLLDQGAQLVEVLPSGAYKRGHLPGAINIPLTKLDKTSAARLDRCKPVVVYCHDSL